MAGFGIRALKKEKESDKTNQKRSFYKHIVIGENIDAILCFLKLYKSHPGEVKLITKNPFYKSDILQQIGCTLNSIRSKAVADKLVSHYPELEIFQTQSDVLFYKDTKFQKFGGRAKPHDVSEVEAFFTKPFYHFKEEHLFESEAFENLDKILESNELNKILSRIEVKKPEDLVEKTNFSLITGEHERIDCEKLYFCESPKTFFGLVSNKEELNDDVQAYIAGLSNHNALSVRLDCKGLVYGFNGTILIPQSMTHEWGSFIIDFDAHDPAQDTQSLKVLSFLDEDDMQEEDLARNIKLMRRVLERVFPELAKLDVSQSIRYSTEYAISGINDEYADSLKSQNVLFYGTASAISTENSEDFHYLARTLISLID